MLLVPLPAPFSAEAQRRLADTHLFLKGVQMLQCSAQRKNTNGVRTSDSLHDVSVKKMTRIVRGKLLEK